MPKLSPETLLANAISNLRNERATLMSRVSEIDASFGRLGIAVAATVAAAVPVIVGKIGKLGKRIGRPPGSKNSTQKSTIAAKPPKAPGKPVTKSAKKGKRGTFAVSGDQSILTFVQGADKPNTADVNAHWTKEGRGGTADNTLSLLVKSGKLKRIVVEGERGSRYSVV